MEQLDRASGSSLQSCEFATLALTTLATLTLVAILLLLVTYFL